MVSEKIGKGLLNIVGKSAKKLPGNVVNNIQGNPQESPVCIDHDTILLQRWVFEIEDIEKSTNKLHSFNAAVKEQIEVVEKKLEYLKKWAYYHDIYKDALNIYKNISENLKHALEAQNIYEQGATISLLKKETSELEKLAKNKLVK